MYATKLPDIRQAHPSECGLCCLAMIMKHLGRSVSLNQLRDLLGTTRDGCNAFELARVASQAGFVVRGIETSTELLAVMRTPVILHLKGNHFVVLGSMVGRQAILHDPVSGRRTVSLRELDELYSGLALVVELEHQEPVGVTTPLRDRIRAIAVAMIIRDRHPGILVTEIAMFAGGAGLVAFAVTLSWSGTLALASTLFLYVTLAGYMYHFIEDTDRTQRTYRDVDTFVYRTGLNREGRDGQRTAVPLMNDVLQPLNPTLGKGPGLVVYATTLAFLSPIATLTTLTLGIIAVGSEICGNLSTRHLREDYRRAEELVIARTADCIGAEQEVRQKLIQAYALAKVRPALRFLVEVRRKLLSQRRLYVAVADACGVVAPVLAFTALVHFPEGGMRSIGLGTLGALMAGAVIRCCRIAGRSSIHRPDQVSLAGKERTISPAPGTTSQIAGPAVVAESLWFKYSDSSPWVIRNMNLAVHCGALVVIVAPSGAGKTTLVRLLVGLLSPTSGAVATATCTLGDPLRVEAAFDEADLIDSTIEDNIVMGRSAIQRTMVLESCRLAGLDRDISLMPLGLSTPVGRRGLSLSRSQRKRIGLARCLAASPDLLILDDPTIDLDSDMAAHIEATIGGLTCTRIVVTSRPLQVQSDQLIWMASDAR